MINKLLNLSFTAFALLAMTFSLLFSGCGDDNGKDEEDKVVLKPSKTEIRNNGETVTFTVTFNGADVTSSATITNKTSSETLENATFSSATAGTYSFTAKYNNVESDPVSVTVTTESPGAGDLKLKSSARRINNDGKDQVQFMVTLDGTDITTDENIKVFNRTSDNELTRTDGKFYFSSSEDGDYIFYATHGENKSEDVLVIVGTAIRGDFYKNIVFTKFTSIGCTPCMVWQEKFEKAMEEYPDRVVEMVLHGDMKDYDDPFKFDYNGMVSTWNFFEYYDSYGFPSGSFDRRQKLNSTYDTAGSLVEMFQDFVKNYPATTGFIVYPELDGNRLNLEIVVGSTKSGNYSLGIALIEDGMMYYQAGRDDNYIHNNVLWYLEPDIKGKDLGTIEDGREVTVKTSFDIPSKVWDVKNCRLLIYTLKEEGNYAYFNNGTYASLTETTTYRYED